MSSAPAPPVRVGHALSGIFVINLRGDVLLMRAYREDIERHVLDAFRTQILNPRGGARRDARWGARRRVESERMSVRYYTLESRRLRERARDYLSSFDMSRSCVK